MPINITPEIQQKDITDGIELIISNNSILFNNLNYTQTLGAAMGTKMAPAYTSLNLAYLEKKNNEK